MSAAPYPKRLIEVDLPIRDISAHSRREKSIRHGHISTLHIWWARRPLASCRAVLCASLWPDPADEHCPQSFRDEAARILCEFAEQVRTDKHVMSLCATHWPRWRSMEATKLRANDAPACWEDMRYALLEFIADFSNWDASNVPTFVATARALTVAAHRELRGSSNPHPLVADPFAGGGAIPVEALRVGADVYASDLNPLAVLLNKVPLTHLATVGPELTPHVRKWAEWVQRRAADELSVFYPKDPDGSSPIAYLWARVVQCEGPACGAELPLMRSLGLARRGNRSTTLKVRTDPGRRRVDFEIGEGLPGGGIVRGGSATCPLCGYTTPSARVREQLSVRHGGVADARLVAVVTTHPDRGGRTYRLAADADRGAFENAKEELTRRLVRFGPDLVPTELIPRERPSPNARGLSAVTRMGVGTFAELFNARQALALTAYAALVREAGALAQAEAGALIGDAVSACLALGVGRLVDRCSTVCTWDPSPTASGLLHAFARQALPFTWDFAEGVPLEPKSGGWLSSFEWIIRVLEQERSLTGAGTATAVQASATAHPLPDDSVQVLFTDPPYYDAVPYADLSEFFCVWLKRAMRGEQSFAAGVPKDEEVIWNPTRIHSPTGKPKDEAFYETQMQRCFEEARRVTAPDGICVVVFAHKSTAGWESILSALLRAGWVCTASWPIDTERANRTNAIGTASLGSSVHIVCRPREHLNRAACPDDVGSWRSVLAELPPRIHAWMPKLAEAGIVGADAIFACIGPALEIFSRYSRVEKASGEPVPLREYLEQVWAAVAREALSLMFDGADASGLEEDARLTAMWLWTLGSGTAGANGTRDGDQPGEVEAPEERDEGSRPKPLTGFILEFDAARKIAQGLGAHLEKLTGVVEVHGEKARLLSVAERAKALFSKNAASADAEPPNRGKARASKKQLGLFAEVEAAEKDSLLGDASIPTAGATTLDRVHQAMILFAAGRSESLKRFVVEEGVGTDGRFWKLAQSFSALYPGGTDEKRWVDGVLARKKSLGF